MFAEESFDEQDSSVHIIASQELNSKLSKSQANLSLSKPYVLKSAAPL
ncbi:MAG: hypothetical protein Q7S21_03835 [archaeon]|nr:hypothetical protein [archaeon]